ncbi:hypothetical protein PS938_01308 [Pseudomonas fluorescens]|uniref:Uncharacterized protein n=1 Tax=Pseudomonas fluorescens TaxID=294 RepID=A0A5E7SM80_PSEFL|nr:hypothetical protein [Pseudomonas fluorescens]VVP87881.1 hypothetical protein PS938_01308 [Pseudomonas fluorescens]
MEGSQVTVIVSIVGAVVGLIALTVAWSQMKIASAKTKLDLYNKRFSVYLAALEYYQTIYSESKDVLKEKSVKLTHAYRESRFLFEERDRIHETLGRVRNGGSAIRAHEEFRKNPNPDPKQNSDMAWQLFEKSQTAYLNMEQDILILEGQLKDYLSFHNVRGWTFF